MKNRGGKRTSYRLLGSAPGRESMGGDGASRLTSGTLPIRKGGEEKRKETLPFRSGRGKGGGGF